MASLGLSIRDYQQNPSLSNAAFVGLDATVLFLPIPALVGYVRHGGELFDAAKAGEKVAAQVQNGVTASKNASNVNNAEALKVNLSFQEAGILKPTNQLTDKAITNSKLIISGEKLGNENVIQSLTSDGSKIADWGKYKTPSVRIFDGSSKQIHFYMKNDRTLVNYLKDYKVK